VNGPGPFQCLGAGITGRHDVIDHQYMAAFHRSGMFRPYGNRTAQVLDPLTSVEAPWESVTRRHKSRSGTAGLPFRLATALASRADWLKRLIEGRWMGQTAAAEGIGGLVVP